MSSPERQKWPIEEVLYYVAKRPDALAALRGSAGRPLTEAVASWPYVMRVTSSWEKQEAAHITLSLYAVHQQSQSTPMNCAGWGLGESCRRLASARRKNGGSEGGIRSRFQVALAAETPDEIAPRLRSLVMLMRAEHIPLDYRQLYWDLCRWTRPEKRPQVCLQWGRGFFQAATTTNKRGTS